MAVTGAFKRRNTAIHVHPGKLIPSTKDTKGTKRGKQAKPQSGCSQIKQWVTSIHRNTHWVKLKALACF